MKVSKAIKICKRNQAAKDKAQHEKDVADLRSRGYTDKQYKCMVDILEDYKLNNPESILNDPASAFYNEVPVVNIDKSDIIPNMDKYYERLNNLYEEPDYVHYEAMKPLNK